MNTLSTIDGRVVDDDAPVKPPSKPKSRMLQRALSAGRGGRVPPSYKDAERSLSPPPRKFGKKFEDADTDSWADTREEIPMKKTSRYESHPDDASRDEASVNSGSSEPGTIRVEKKYIERAASTGRARSTGRYRIESRPRYRDQPKKNKTLGFHANVDNSELQLEPKVGYSIQTGVQQTVSGLTASSPKAWQRKHVGFEEMRDVPPPPPGVSGYVQSSPAGVVTAPNPAPVTPENVRHVSFQTPDSLMVRSYSTGQVETTESKLRAMGMSSPNVNKSSTPTSYNHHSWQEQSRKEQARQRLQERMASIDSRVKGRHSIGVAERSPKPWETDNARVYTRHVLDGVPDQDQSKLIVPPLMDEDGVWRDPVSSPTGAAGVGNGAFDEGTTKALQSRVEYYKTCLKSNEKKLDELIESEKELNDMLKKQQQDFEEQQKEDTELHQKEMNKVNEAMADAKNAIDALESTIMQLKKTSIEKDVCISELKEKLSLMEMELKEKITTHEERKTVYEKQVASLKGDISELEKSGVGKDKKISLMEKTIKGLEEKVTQLTDQCSQTESAFKESCGTVQEKEQLLAKTVQEMEQEKNDLVFNFEQYRGDLEYKMEAATVRMESITKEKDNLIDSLNRKVELLEASLVDKEGEVKECDEWRMKQVELEADWMLKEKELNQNIQTLAMSLTEKDKELDNFQRLLEHERKLKAASDERIGAIKNELSKCQQELIDERRKRAASDKAEERYHAKIVAHALSPRSAARRNHHHSSRRAREPRQDPPVSPRARRGERSPRHRHRSARQEREYYGQVEESSSTEYESTDSIFEFSS